MRRPNASISAPARPFSLLLSPSLSSEQQRRAAHQRRSSPAAAIAPARGSGSVGLLHLLPARCCTPQHARAPLTGAMRAAGLLGCLLAACYLSAPAAAAARKVRGGLAGRAGQQARPPRCGGFRTCLGRVPALQTLLQRLTTLQPGLSSRISAYRTPGCANSHPRPPPAPLPAALPPACSLLPRPAPLQWTLTPSSLCASRMASFSWVASASCW